MHYHRIFTLALTLCTLATACDREAPKPKADPPAKVDPPPPVAQPDPPVVAEVEPAPDPRLEKVEQAATVAREIASTPDQADAILSKHGMDRSQLDALMFEIAGDQTLTAAYMEARRNS